MAETVSLRFTGGPSDGGTVMGEADWPPPDTLDVSGTRWSDWLYVQTSRSQLPGGMQGIVRGAMYEWWPRTKYEAMVIERESFDPDDSTYPSHEYSPSVYGNWCSVCGRERTSPRGTMGSMHPEQSDLIERAMDGNR